jgi:hypothetical protein
MRSIIYHINLKFLFEFYKLTPCNILSRHHKSYISKKIGPFTVSGNFLYTNADLYQLEAIAVIIAPLRDPESSALSNVLKKSANERRL